MSYFSIEEIQPKVELYAQLYHTDREKAMEIINDIYPDLNKVVQGVIFTHKFTQYGIPYDDLVSTAFIALLGKSGLAKFDANYTGYKGKKENLLFSFISLIAKRALIYETMRFKKSREEHDIDFHINSLYCDEEEEFNYINFINESDVYIRPYFINTRFYSCYDYLIKYIKINGAFNKRDFFRMVVKMLNTEEDVIPHVGTRLDAPNVETRARAIVRRTIKQYRQYLVQYLKENNHGYSKFKESII